MKFNSVVLLGGKTATGIEVPEEVVSGLGSSKRPAVSVTINGYTYRSTIAPYNGKYMLPISAENRAGAKVAAGDETRRVLETNSKSNYREQLEKELKEVADSEMWQAGTVVRALRPERAAKSKG